jgi:hypothetical protein
MRTRHLTQWTRRPGHRRDVELNANFRRNVGFYQGLHARACQSAGSPIGVTAGLDPSDCSTTSVAPTKSGTRLARPARQLHGLTHRLAHAGLLYLPFARDVEGGAMID